MKERIKKIAEEYFNECVEIRRHLHENPELSYQEHKTSEYIKDELKKIGIPYKDGYVNTGIVGTITCKNPDYKTIALRADMDALPVRETNILAYKSKNEGVMHACGHDLHVASLIGTAKILYRIKNELKGNILLVFQPAEEKLPGGAIQMLEEGAFDDQKPDLFLAQHVLPGLKAGKIGLKEGKYMASVDEIFLTVKGKGGHAAMPHQLIDPILITSHIITSLQQIVSRHVYAGIPSVLSFGKIDAPGATNIIPSEVKIEGTFRTMDELWRKEAHNKIAQMSTSIAEGMGGKCDVNIKNGYPALINNNDKTKEVHSLAATFLGQENVENIDFEMTSEDFAYFSQRFPSVFYRLGIMDDKETIIEPLHSPAFNLDEKAIYTGMSTMAYIVAGLMS